MQKYGEEESQQNEFYVGISNENYEDGNFIGCWLEFFLTTNENVK